ncbi:hypothetical protein [Petroclostridium sp. X23]|uniref:hypothetical protein n=1 Tax=Petroclostridium sp. X23 TaxID=3045146 RepID=UPI0024ACED74|nr:hypothetical protein [Petroclostridium sp. X23]WHH56930.1 hypothetical protein QKW49_13835 [Petroclostridium sp. X23]
MARKQKVNEIMFGIGLLMLGALAFVFTLWLTALPPEGGRVYSKLLGEYQIHSLRLKPPIMDALLWLFMPVPTIFALEGGVMRLRMGLKVREQSLQYQPKTLWAKLGIFNQYSDILNTTFFMFVFMVFFAFGVHELWYAPKVLSSHVLFVAITVISYLVTRKQLRSVWEKFVNWFRRGMPTYELAEDGIIINLVTMMNKKDAQPPPVYIRFDEIDELRVLTFVEVEAFKKYNIGPDIELSIRQSVDIARYIKLEIARPSVYTFTAGSSGDCNVFIRGPELFYLIAFETDNVFDLVEAYDAYKASVKIHDSNKSMKINNE